MHEATEGSPTLIGPLESDAYEIIELIDSYSLPGDFFTWLSDGSFTNKVIHQKIENGKFTRIVQYFIDDALVYTGRGEFDVSLFPKETIQFLARGERAISKHIPGLANFRRDRISKVASDPFYTVICNLYNRDIFSGVSWEVYELPQISTIYNQKEDPLRYWRNTVLN